MLSKETKHSLKITATNVTLVANAFVWYFLVFKTLRMLLDHLNSGNSGELALLVFGVNAAAIAISALIGSFITEKIKNRSNFLSLWMLIGIILSLVPLLLNILDPNHILVISFVFGAYFGLGMPAIMGYFSSNSKTENRAKLSGITFLLTFLLFAVLGAFVVSDIVIACSVLSAIRLVGLLIFLGLKEKKPSNQETPQALPKVSYKEIFSNKSFILYFASWCMLSLVNYMTVPIQNALFNSNSTYVFLVIILESIITAITAVVCGFIADRFGRKRLTIIGFILLGIGYAVLGLFPIQVAGYFYVAADGVAWGIFNIVFLLIIWGDLAQGKNSDKFYFLGALPYLTSKFLQMLFAFYVPDISKLPIFSFASVFLFLAVLPLVYAPETLSEKLMKERELKNYLDKAKKIASKESEEKPKCEKTKDQEKETEALEEKEENSKEQDEARKLAEKYY